MRILNMNYGNIEKFLELSIFSTIKSKMENKVKLTIAPGTLTQIRELVKIAETEVGWMCTAERTEEGFHISGLYIYPQIVSAITVEQDDEMMPLFYDSLNTEVVNKMRAQGHSHVRMLTAPSPTDLRYYADMSSTYKDFYIFMIFNKKDEMYFTIHDIENNIIIDDTDIELIDPLADMLKEKLKKNLRRTNDKSSKTSKSV